MPQTVADNPYPRSIHRWDQAGTNWVLVNLPRWAKRVAITFESEAGFVSHTVNDDDPFTTAIAALAEDVPAGATYSVPVSDGQGATQVPLLVRVGAQTDITVVAEASKQG